MFNLISPQNPPPSSTLNGLQRFLALLPVIILFWVFFFIRLHNIEAMPLFVDEIRHIARGGVVYEFTDIDTNTTPRKFLLYYWMGLFGMPNSDAQWMGRIPIPIFALFGAAATFSTAKLLFNRRIAYGSVLFLAFFPFMIYHERLALSDPMTASFVILMIWWGLVLLRRPTHQNAFIFGCIITAMLAAKTLALPMLIMPFLTIGLLSVTPVQIRQPIWPQIKALWQRYKPLIIRTVIVIAVFWIVVLTVYLLRVVFAPDTISPIINRYLYAESDQGTNLTRLLEILHHYWSIPTLLVTALTLPFALSRYPQATLFLIIGIVVMWVGLLLTANRLSSRYATLVGHLWAILIVVGIFSAYEFWQARFPRFAWLGGLMASVFFMWIIFFGTNFWLLLGKSPDELPLPSRDEEEYFANQSGYGIPEMMDAVQKHYTTTPAISAGIDEPVVYGIMRNCGFMPYHLPSDIPVRIECYLESHRHSDEWPDVDDVHADLNRHLNQYGALYLIAEQFTTQSVVHFEDIQGCMVLLTTYQRPYHGVTLELYAVYTVPPPNATCASTFTLPVSSMKKIGL